MCCPDSTAPSFNSVCALLPQFSSDGGKEARLPVVHNYGHGGAGVTLSWGCALDTLDLVRQALS